MLPVSLTFVYRLDCSFYYFLLLFLYYVFFVFACLLFCCSFFVVVFICCFLGGGFCCILCVCVCVFLFVFFFCILTPLSTFTEHRCLLTNISVHLDTGLTCMDQQNSKGYVRVDMAISGINA